MATSAPKDPDRTNSIIDRLVRDHVLPELAARVHAKDQRGAGDMRPPQPPALEGIMPSPAGHKGMAVLEDIRQRCVRLKTLASRRPVHRRKSFWWQSEWAEDPHKAPNASIPSDTAHLSR